MATGGAALIRHIDGLPNAWGAIDGLRRIPGGVSLTLAAREGRKGRLVGRWEVRCLGLRELELSDLDGGGVRMYDGSHPAARQFTDPLVRLSCSIGADGARALGALLVAHAKAVDDWIPTGRHLPVDTPTTDRLNIRAPAFLARVYARSLLKAGFTVRLGAAIRRKSPRPRVLHLGDSYVVAERFETR